jgi:hypothetical protein
MLLDRPVVVVDCPELIAKARVNAAKVALLRRASEVTPAHAVAAAVSRALGAPRRHSDERCRIASELFYRAGGAGARAVRCVYSILGLPAPDAMPADARLQPHSAPAGVLLSDYQTRTTNHA